MAISLSKGQKIVLTKCNSELSNIAVGLGWDTNRYDGKSDFDLDSQVFLVSSTGKVRDQADFVFFGNLRHQSGAVEHSGDNRTGIGNGDDELIKINLHSVPPHVEKIIITASIFEADQRNQNFGQVENAYIRVYDIDKNELLLEYDLDEDFSVETAIVFAELQKFNGSWKFNAVGNGFFGGLPALCKTYGINVE
ncbi:TerD family protein [Candidatus Epulonipiscium viviparus]|uniref:TerD family protein n=1 Tax=Candidatus Epulonipiscium viviparus TaxID=420336 RepID=UPI00016BFC7F|nr:TerD family protein [Candidatus Epulopiscium viviparus]